MMIEKMLAHCDWDIVGVPAEPGIYVWEGVPKPIYETEEGCGKYVAGYSYDLR